MGLADLNLNEIPSAEAVKSALNFKNSKNLNLFGFFLFNESKFAIGLLNSFFFPGLQMGKILTRLSGNARDPSVDVVQDPQRIESLEEALTQGSCFKVGNTSSG